MAERKIHPGVVIVGGLVLGAGAALGAVYLLAQAAPPPPPPPGLANVRIDVIDTDGDPLREALFALDSLECLTNASGICDLLELEPGAYAGHCSKSGYKVISVILNGVEITFSDGSF